MSANGIKTSFWGPHAWNFLFSSIAGAYPIKFNQNDPSHIRKLKGFTQLINSLKETLPCIYCRQSYAKFIKDLPMHNYTHSRQSMMKWLYLLHDKVNKKLIKQEKECYDNELAKLKQLLASKKITQTKYNQSLKNLKTILLTKPSPPFSDVLAKYERQRAGCNPKSKKCA